jgi:hypothetical protein
VLCLAPKSTYLTFAIGVALAAPLPSYLRLFRGGRRTDASHLTETAVFNFSGESSSGKTSVTLAALSIAASPERAGTLDISHRGLAEHAHESNDLPFVLDDTEKSEDGPGTLVKTLKSLVHMVPGGRSKRVARGIEQFPELTWSTFALSSSPRPVPSLAAEHGWTMSKGDKVRLFDIRVPTPGLGGVFDRIAGSPQKRGQASCSVITSLENGYMNHHGHVFPEWVLYLIKKDRSARILEYVDEFVDHVIDTRDGWEVRFARKFGVIYAALRLGSEAGMLPWPSSLPLKAVRKCYRIAWRAAKTAQERAGPASNLIPLLEIKGSVIDVKSSRPTEVDDRCIAIRFKESDRSMLGLIDDQLLSLFGSKKAKNRFTTQLAADGLLQRGHGHAGTIQKRLPIKHNGRLVKKPRLWVIDERRFKRFLRAKT